MKKILVTGAGGFIGSHLVEELVKKNYSIKALIKYNGRNNWGNLELLSKEILSQVEIVLGDITDPFFVDDIVKGCDTVFHLAALIGIPYSYIAPDHYVKVNINGTLNILQAARRYGVSKIIHTSTSETYGTAIYTPIDEKHPLQGQSPYSATKIAADKIVESFYCSFNLPVITIRPFNTFGPRQSARAVIPTIIMQYLSTYKKIKLGSLSPVRDFNYVKDTVSGFIKALESENAIGKVINLGTGKGISISDLVKIVEKITGIQKEIIVDNTRIRPDGSEVLKLICDNGLAKKYLKWEPQYSLEEGLLETIKFIKENLHLFKTKQYTL